MRFLVLFVSLALGAADAQTAVRAFESRYRHARTLKAIFFQSYHDGKGGISADSGTVYFSKPGRMRWEYESPEEKLFLVDGSHVWFYVPADHTASRAKLSESSDWRTPLALLAGKTDLSKLCRHIEPAAPSSMASEGSLAPTPTPAGTVLRCIPRQGQETDSIHELLLEIDPQGFLTRILIQEAGNATTEFRFGNWEEILAISEAKFHFAPPPGVAVVDQQALAGSIH